MKKIFFLLFVALVPFVSFSEEQKLNIIPVEKGDRTEIGVPKISYDPDMQMLSVAFHASGDYMLYIINGSGLKYIVELLKYLSVTEKFTVNVLASQSFLFK